MSRRVVFILAFLLFAGCVIWYATAFVRIPESTFAEAAKIEDKKVKVMVAVTVLDKEITPNENTVTFFAKDTHGDEMKVLFDQADPLSAGQLSTAAKRKSKITMAGHVDPDHFHASTVFFPAY